MIDIIYYKCKNVFTDKLIKFLNNVMSYIDIIKYKIYNFNHEMNFLYIQDYWGIYFHARFKNFEVWITHMQYWGVSWTTLADLH